MNPADYLRAQNLTELTLFYPGGGTDDGPLALACRTAPVAHVIYADYGLSRRDVEAFLRRRPFLGVKSMRSVGPGVLGAESWDEYWATDLRARNFSGPERAFGIGCGTHHRGLEREEEFIAREVSFLYLATEAVGTYARLLASQADNVPDFVVLQDHGFGGNWTHFGGENELWQAAAERLAFPRFLLVAENTRPWPGYEQVTGYEPTPGQMHSFGRALFVRSPG